jgi:hypothetical protein
MKQAQIILRFLLPPRQNAAKTVHPTMRPFRNPAASFETGFSFNRLCFFTTRTNMSGITKLFYQISHLTRIITLIQTHTLRLLLRRLRTLYGDTFYRSLDHLAIMPICSVNRQANRHTRRFGQQTPFNAFFGAVCRVWARFFPRPAGPCSWRRPSTAKTNLSLSARHSLAEPTPRVSERHRLWSIPETLNERCCSNKYQFRSMRSTDSQFSIQKTLHPWLCDPAPAACRHRNDVYSDVLAAMAQFFPITRLKSYICSFDFAQDKFLSFVFSSLNPFKGTIAFEYIGHSGVIRIGS